MQVCAKLKDIVRFGIRGAQGKLALRYNHINESLPMEPRTTRPTSIPNLGYGGQNSRLKRLTALSCRKVARGAVSALERGGQCVGGGTTTSASDV